ncbi:MAG: histidine kinase [Chitinispirillia bacterium]|jgi:sensor histidine kinase YesM
MNQNSQINLFFYLSVFLVTQITGLLLSIIICFIFQDFIWGFFRAALINSFILGISLVINSFLSQKLIHTMKFVYIFIISSSIVFGTGIVSFLLLLFFEPTLFIYYFSGVISFLLINLLFILALHVISSGLMMYRETMAQKEIAIEKEKNLRNQMEMKLLSSKTNPHFLFNSLNMIITLLKKPLQAETAILDLSDLLRNNLENSEKSKISIEEELDSVKKYLSIQKLRFQEKLQYEIINSEKFDIPPLIVQPLVENSIKHNISKETRLTITICILRENQSIKIKITDSAKGITKSMLNKGTGLTITKKRIENFGGTFLILNGGIEISFKI